MKKRTVLSPALALAIASALVSPGLRAADPADWKNFTSATGQTWSTAGSWTAGTGIPTSGPGLTIDFDPAAAGATTSGGNVSNGFTSTNDLGTVQLHTLNLSGSSSSATARAIIITGGTLQFEGAGASINNTTTTNGATGTVNYTIGSTIALNADTAVVLNGTGASSLTGSIAAFSPGLKTLTFSGTGNATTQTGAISDGAGQIGITQSGTGSLSLGGTNTFTGDVLIKSGTVSAGTAGLGAGAVKLGDTIGTAGATLVFTNNSTYSGNTGFTVQAGSTGTKTFAVTGGGTAPVSGALLTLNGDLTLNYSGGAGGGFTIGSSSAGTWLTGAGNLNIFNNGTGSISITGTNTGYTGNVTINTGITRASSAGALVSANSLAVASGATFNINSQAVSITGLNNVAGAGGTVTNAGATAKVMTLTGSGNYSFDGVITASTPANLALTKSGSGTQILTGASTYTGATIISGGALVVDGSLSSLSSVSLTNGTLGGSGLVGGLVTTAGAASVLSPGDSLGTLTLSGGLNASAGASFNFGLGTSQDLLNLGSGVFTGSSAANGLRFDFTNSGGLTGGTLYTLATFGSAVSLDSTDLFVNSLPSGFALNSFQINGTSLQVQFTAVPEPGTWALFLGGTTMLTACVRRRRRLVTT